MQDAATAAPDLRDSIRELQALRTGRNYEEVVIQAAPLLTDMPQLSPVERGVVLTLTGRAEMALHRLSQAEEHLTQAADAYAEAGLEQQAAQTQLFLARAMLIAGSLRQVEHLAQRGLAEAIERAWPQQEAYARLLLGMVLIREHRYREAMPLLAEAHSHFHRTPAEDEDREFLHDSSNALAWALAGSGQVAEGMLLAEEELARLEQAGASETELTAQLNALIFAAWCAGDFTRMRPLQQRMLELERRLKRPMQLMTLYYNMAIAETQLGGFHSAKRHLHRAWDIARRTGDVRLLPPLLMLLSLLALHENHPALAREYAELARSNMREFGTDESSLLAWYLALAYMGGGELPLARQEWARRPQLDESIENWLELAWLRRALAHVASEAYHPNPQLNDEGRALAREWEAELAELLTHYPAPEALAAAAA
jgi:hypothetical protein